MIQASRRRALPLVVLAGLILSPALAGAGGRGFVSVGGGNFHGGGKFHGGGAKIQGGFIGAKHAFVGGRIPQPVPSVFPTTVDPWKFWGVRKGHHHRHHHFKHGVHAGTVFAGGTSIIYEPVPVYAAPQPVVYAAPPVAYAPAPMPTVVEYATGRYELRGDGITSAYQWVWIPKPPTAPPPDVAPEPAPQSSPPARDRSIGKIYRWTDDEGVTTFTDRLENVPDQYRSRVQPKA